MLQQTTRDWDKSVEVKQQVIPVDYFSRTPALQISKKLTHRKFGTRQAVPDRKIWHYASGRIFLSGVRENGTYPAQQHYLSPGGLEHPVWLPTWILEKRDHAKISWSSKYRSCLTVSMQETKSIVSFWTFWRLSIRSYTSDYSKNATITESWVTRTLQKIASFLQQRTQKVCARVWGQEGHKIHQVYFRGRSLAIFCSWSTSMTYFRSCHQQLDCFQTTVCCTGKQNRQSTRRSYRATLTVCNSGRTDGLGASMQTNVKCWELPTNENPRHILSIEFH